MDAITIILLLLAAGGVTLGIVALAKLFSQKRALRELGGAVGEQFGILEDAIEKARRELIDETRKCAGEIISANGDALRAQKTQLDAFAQRLDSAPAIDEGRMDERFNELTLQMKSVYEGLTDIRSMSTERYDPEESAEIWRMIDQTRGEFEVFAEALSKTQKRIRQANESIEDAARKSQLFNKRLKHARGEENQ